MIQHIGPIVAAFMAFFVGLSGFAGTAFTAVTTTELAGVVAVETTPEISTYVGGDVITYDEAGYSITVPEGWEAMSLPAEMKEDVGEIYFGVAGLYDGGTVILFDKVGNVLTLNVALPVIPGDADTLKAMHDFYANEVMVPEQSETAQMGNQSVLMYSDGEGGISAIMQVDELMFIIGGYSENDGLGTMLETAVASIELTGIER